MTIQDWRDSMVPKKIEVVHSPVHKAGFIQRLRARFAPHKAGCGHVSPLAYGIIADGKEVELAAAYREARCPECAVEHVRREFVEGLSHAVACVGCGSPIFPGSMIGACVSVGKKPEYPITLTDDRLMIICSSCACMAATIYGYWDGAKAVRLSADQVRKMCA